MSPVEILFAFLLLSPLTGLVLLPLKRQNRFLFFLLLSLVPSVNTLLLMQQGLVTNSLHFGPFAFSLDRFSFLFVSLLNVCWFVTIIYSSDFVRYHFQEKAKRFYGLMSVALTLITGAGISDNLFTLYLYDENQRQRDAQTERTKRDDHDRPFDEPAAAGSRDEPACVGRRRRWRDTDRRRTRRRCRAGDRWRRGSQGQAARSGPAGRRGARGPVRRTRRRPVASSGPPATSRPQVRSGRTDTVP